MKLKTLGLKSVDLNQQESIGFLLEYGSKNLLLDCGVYTSALLKKKLNMEINEINEVFISHSHIDHWAGLLWLINSYSFIEYYDSNSNSSNLNVIINENEKKIIDLIKSNFSYLIGYNGNSLSVREIDKKSNINNKISFFNIPHTVDNTGIRIEHEEKSFCYVPDIGEVNEDVINSVKNCDFLLISVASHDNKEEEMKAFGFLTTKDACRLCNEANVKNVAFFHTYFDEDVDLIKNNAKKSLLNTNIIDLEKNPIISI